MNMSVFLSIGTNQGNLKQNIKRALCKISEFAFIKKISKPYRTKPYGYLNQPDFINLAVEVSTDLLPLEFLKKCRSVEKELGRVSTERWGPRIIDIDIIFWDDRIINENELVIPHYDMHNREFVLKPLLDICPEFVHPVYKKTVSELYAELTLKEEK